MIDNEYLFKEELAEDVSKIVMKQLEPKFNNIFLKLADIYAQLAKITMRQFGFNPSKNNPPSTNIKAEEANIKSVISDIERIIDQHNLDSQEEE